MGTYNRNLETGKLEMFFDKSEYLALTDEQKSEIKSNFLFSRRSSAWISRCKFPNLCRAEMIAESLGLENTGEMGEKLTFEEQQERKAARAEARAERYDYKAERAEKTAESLQKPINDMHGDIAFFTQPNIDTSAGRAFTRRRNRMWESYERGMQEFRKSAYYQERAETARKTAADTKTHDKGFCQRRIDDANRTIRAQKKNIAHYESQLAKLDNGEILKSWNGEVLKRESIEKWLDHSEEIIEDAISKAAYYDALIQEAGGIIDKDTINKGDYVTVSHWGKVRVVRKGPKNFTFEFLEPHMKYADGSPMQGKAAYAEIKEVITA